ncbi:DNRLRE domain-containing protein [Micromonospora sp. M12]
MVPVDTTLAFDKAGRVAPRTTSVGLSLSGGGDAALVRVTRDGKELEFGWHRALPRPTLEGDTATYANVLPDVDLVVKADVEGFSEVFVIRTPEAAANPELTTARFAVATKGLNVTTDTAGNIKALDSEGRTVFNAPTPRMWDSGGTAEPGASVSARTFENNQGAKQAEMKTSIRNGCFTRSRPGAAQGIGHPVPGLPGSGAGRGARLAWTSVWKTFPNSKYWNSSDIARVGYSLTDNLTNRSFFRMDTSKVKGKNIIRATFQTYETHAWSCDKRVVELWRTGAISSSTTWNNQPGWITRLDTADVARGYDSSCPDGGVDFDATAGVKTSAAANAGDVTLGLRATNESDKWAWKSSAITPR